MVVASFIGLFISIEHITDQRKIQDFERRSTDKNFVFSMILNICILLGEGLLSLGDCIFLSIRI
jgi:hypothetical protein